ncbi:hypothetical protein NPIL_696171 [Nephila pilipes]|uniref:Uncharacterized protein n=1 Tax=Nephila pilipes TaxID=299642 RepID=A0A8X6IUU7_NEPPI|nr:hypothetical protein NPIL_696171 [Nephila pilipes]
MTPKKVRTTPTHSALSSATEDLFYWLAHPFGDHSSSYHFQPFITKPAKSRQVSVQRIQESCFPLSLHYEARECSTSYSQVESSSSETAFLHPLRVSTDARKLFPLALHYSPDIWSYSCSLPCPLTQSVCQKILPTLVCGFRCAFAHRVPSHAATNALHFGCFFLESVALSTLLCPLHLTHTE